MIHGKGVVNPSFRHRTAYHAMLLGGVALITSALIVIGNKQTHADIELRRIEDIKNSLAQVIHPDSHTNDLLEDVTKLKINNETKYFYIARSNEEVIAVAFNMISQGYAGPIDILLGINRKGELLGVRVLSHSETPGLGDKIESEKHSWIFRFNGLSLSNPGESQWKVKKDGGDFDAFTGATITPRAVISAIKSGLQIFKTNQTVLLAETNPKNTKTPIQEPNDSINQKNDARQEMKQDNLQTTTQRGQPNG